MIENRDVVILTEFDGTKIVVINDIVFKGKQNIDWDNVKEYLKGYIGDFYEISESAEKIYIGSKLSDEYTNSEARKALRGANAKAKANAASAIPVYDNEILIRYNIYGARLLVNHSHNGKKYLYDILAIKKETSKPHHFAW